MARLFPSGTPDTAFSPGGNDGPGIHSDRVGTVNDLVVDDQGRILAGGAWRKLIAPNDTDVFLERLTSAGEPDATFPDLVFGYADGRQDGSLGLALQPDGKIVMAGFTDTATEFDVGAARSSAAGALDAGFGTGGKLSFGLGTNAVDAATAVVLQPDGKIDLAGFGTPGDDFTLTRLTSGGVLDSSLNGASTVSAASAARTPRRRSRSSRAAR